MHIYNPLDNFQSYSTHFVMTACRTTQTAKLFSEEDQGNASLAAIEDAKFLGSAVKFNNNETDIFLVLDTRRFSQFSVESLKYDIYVNGLQKGGSTSNLAVDMNMVILDSVGISFANFMQWLIDYQMQSNYDGIIFMLRVIFVGHHPDGTSETIQSETIPLHLNRMDINLDYAKGIYTLEFMPNMNFNVNTYKRFLTISTATTATTGLGNTLGSAISSFQDNLNKTSSEYYEGIQKIFNEATNNSSKPVLEGSNLNSNEFGRKVTYMITIPPDWKAFILEGSNIGGSLESIYKKQFEIDAKAAKTSTSNSDRTKSQDGALKDSYIAAPAGEIITKVLDAVFRQVPQIAASGNFQIATDKDAATGMVKFFKYIVGITTDDKTMTVHIDVVDFKIPDVFNDESKKNPTGISKENANYHPADPEKGGIREPKNFIEYDYIFSGKNKDILNFEMKIQEFQFLLSSNLRIGDSAIKEVVDTGKEIVGGPKANMLIYSRKYDPMVLPLNTVDSLANFKNQSHLLKTSEQSKDMIAKRQQYTKNLTTFYAGSPITVALTIKGNPLIMHKFNIGKILPHSGDNIQKSAVNDQTLTGPVSGESGEDAYRRELINSILKTNPSIKVLNSSSLTTIQSPLDDDSYAISPVFARINIFGPNVDFKNNSEILSDENGEATYTASVMSNNYYVVFKVSNIFSNGVFTQELELYSHNLFGKNKINTAAKIAPTAPGTTS